MKKGLTKVVVVAAFIIALIYGGALLPSLNGMPIQGLTPEQQADILLGDTRREITAMKLDLVNGVITVEQWEMQMYGLKARLGVQRVILENIRDSDMPWSQKQEALLKVFPWNVRNDIGYLPPQAKIIEGGYACGGDSEVEVITYKISIAADGSSYTVENMARIIGGAHL